MDKVIALKTDEKRELFEESARRLGGIPAILVEKDFWVCWTLKQIFSLGALKNQVIFKGGTSLSKVYKIIDRFSEDIDLTMSPGLIGLTDDKQPKTAASRKERDRRLSALQQAATDTVQTKVLKTLKDRFSALLNEHSLEWRLAIDTHDPQTILFFYPRTLNYDKNFGEGSWGTAPFGEGEPGYIKPTIRIELGARGEQWPAKGQTITPYAAEAIPESFENATVKVQTLAVERTYWEKITLLHAEHHRAKDKTFPARLSRHYYDVFKLDQAGITTKALSEKSLLTAVVENKSVYFPSAWASYDKAKLGSLEVRPSPNHLDAVKSDYRSMEEMFFGDFPDFDHLLEGLQELEKRLNTSE